MTHTVCRVHGLASRSKKPKVYNFYPTVLTLASCLRDSVASVVCRLSVTLRIVAKRCVLEQELLLIAYRKLLVRGGRVLGEYTGIPRDAPTPYPWSCSFGWCPAEGRATGNGDQSRPMGP